MPDLPRETYDFLKSHSKKHWLRLGVKRRAGVLVPLFSLHSKKSIGVGEIPDLKLLADWCRKTGLSLIQLLPMNDVGFNFRPYDAESSLALEPMHLSLEDLFFVNLAPFRKDLESLRKRFASQGSALDTQIKQAKIELLKEIFRARKKEGEKPFKSFIHDQHFWIRDYALYKILKKKMNGRSWEEWPEDLKNRSQEALSAVEIDEKENLTFQAWMQWQLFLQFREAKQYAKTRGVFLVGDLPFLVSRDSADVWANPGSFRLDLSSGAPPDLYYKEGQEWGMPPYDWEAMAKKDYDYLRVKLKYAENFYDAYRIDHFVGVFRLWVYQRDLPHDQRRASGAFLPAEESVWEALGRKIVSVMLDSTRMLACAEDLGTIPACSSTVLKEYGIPGMDVQRWTRDWEKTQDFKEPEEYRKNSIAVISTHDLEPLVGWWEKETEPVERERFWKYLGLKGSPSRNASAAFVQRCLEKINQSRSIFSIQLLQDWLSLAKPLAQNASQLRINVPGSLNEQNWRLRFSLSLDEMISLSINQSIKQINLASDRI